MPCGLSQETMSIKQQDNATDVKVLPLTALTSSPAMLCSYQSDQLSIESTYQFNRLSSYSHIHPVMCLSMRSANPLLFHIFNHYSVYLKTIKSLNIYYNCIYLHIYLFMYQQIFHLSTLSSSRQFIISTLPLQLRNPVHRNDVEICYRTIDLTPEVTIAR